MELAGEVYPPWRWFEKENAIKDHNRKRGSVRVDEFYNIMLERQKCATIDHNSFPDFSTSLVFFRDELLGYDVLFVDPIRKGNFASRMAHSCNPNCSTGN